MTTRNEILSLLRRDPLTISELADRLDLARNAIVLPLQQLEAEGLVEGTTRKEKRAGKPALEYSVAPGQEDVASRAYPPFTEILMEVLPEQLSGSQMKRLMHQVGQKMAARLQPDERQSFDKRLKLATDFVDNLGAETVVETQDECTVIRSYSCPLARAVRQQPCVCHAVSTFFAQVTGKKVKQQCNRDGQLICEFVITP